MRHMKHGIRNFRGQKDSVAPHYGSSGVAIRSSQQFNASADSYYLPCHCDDCAIGFANYEEACRKIRRAKNE